jgi:hypothetical protein
VTVSPDMKRELIGSVRSGDSVFGDLAMKQLHAVRHGEEHSTSV